jgi:hypothetical protein
MNKPFILLFLGLLLLFNATAQQTVAVISKCGGVDSVTIPAITDNDHDGMDDQLEQMLIDRFMPTFIEFDNESCPGPATDGTGDSNLVVCHIYPIPQQYTANTNLSLVLTNPVAVVPRGGLYTGLVWYNTIIKVNAALLYGEDCGLLGHTADVEGFNYSLRYIGPDTLAGWMYDTVMQNWIGAKIQTISHEGTLCEQIETFAYRSALAPTGKDTVYCSPDKHGNYLTIGGCGASVICNPGCGGIPSHKNVKAVNIGEPNASLMPDLDVAYAGYAGNDPWGTAKFLDAEGGNAGQIKTKMLLDLTSDFIQGTTLTTQAQICNIYSNCFSTGSSYSDYVCNGQPYQFFNQQLNTTGTYYHTLPSSHGCDSTIRIDLTVLPVSATTQIQTVCSSYNFLGSELTTSGIYLDTLTNTNGCDSVITLNLTINQPVSYAYNVIVCVGNTYMFNGNELTESGVYTNVLTAANGCDSTVQLTLLVDTVPDVTLTINADTIAPDNHAILLTGGSPVGGVYSGPGVSGNVFFPSVAGEGAHTISYTYTDAYSCSDTATQQIVILSTGIGTITGATAVSVYPNPAIGSVNVVAPQGSRLVLFAATGNMVKAALQTRTIETLDISTLPAGIYTLQVTTSYGVVMQRLIVR